jgi:transcriptional regulator with XRE-family HTH domain
MNIENQLSQLQSQLRKVRISKGLTLSQVSILSKGTISAIALGSYERGDRSISAEKLLEIAQLYQVPVSELMSPTEKGIRSGRVIIDVNKLANNLDHSNDAALKIIQRIAHLRHDWNGQVISLRSSDIDLLKIFANYSDQQTNNFLDNFALAKLK